MSASGAQNVVRGVHSSSAWDVAWDVVEDELLGMTLGMAVALQDSLCLGPQIQVTDIKRNIARVIDGDVPVNIVETLLAPVSLLAWVLSAAVALARLRWLAWCLFHWFAQLCWSAPLETSQETSKRRLPDQQQINLRILQATSRLILN